MPDHDTDAYYKISCLVDGQPSGGLTRTTSTTSPCTG
jgi:hypothetical protein